MSTSETKPFFRFKPESKLSSFVTYFSKTWESPPFPVCYLKTDGVRISNYEEDIHFNQENIYDAYFSIFKTYGRLIK